MDEETKMFVAQHLSEHKRIEAFIEEQERVNRHPLLSREREREEYDQLHMYMQRQLIKCVAVLTVVLIVVVWTIFLKN